MTAMNKFRRLICLASANLANNIPFFSLPWRAVKEMVWTVSRRWCLWMSDYSVFGLFQRFQAFHPIFSIMYNQVPLKRKCVLFGFLEASPSDQLTPEEVAENYLKRNERSWDMLGQKKNKSN